MPFSSEDKALSKNLYQFKQESPANAKGTRDSSACMKDHCEQMQKTSKNLYFSAQGHSRSLLSVSIETRV